MLADRIGGIFAILIGLVGIGEAWRLHGYAGDQLVGDHTLPLVLGITMVVLGAILGLLPPKGEQAEPLPAWPILKKMMVCILCMGGYCLLIPITGYLLPTCAAAWVLFRVIGDYPVWKSLLVAALLTSCLYLVFIMWLKITFPAGWLF